MDIYEIRRRNLQALVNERFGGKKARLADAIDRQSSYISRCLSSGSHRKRIGEEFARHTEASLGLVKGWLDEEHLDKQAVEETPIETYGKPTSDNELTFTGNMDPWDRSTPIADDEVELPLFREVALSGGGGRTQVVENNGAALRFKRSTLRSAGVSRESAACAFVEGHSMEPILPDGASVGVNTADRQIKDGKMYAIDHEGLLRVKFLYRLPGGGLRIRSANPDKAEHPDEDLDENWPEKVNIIGKVFWYSVLLH
ncbi:S24 family peptidase [Salinicola rhizosphaerae]|uniref:Transcriptional regulator n=1 Tax=Salinicola rhizosphaerae TaxID=1443141 RepID=A0ABQ3E9L0_9GAMM|nr:helix-turn-helix transcriptional regulator [Salinicola rhizosphaerae]GHB30734.1 transcriptional regulator [Salinicola rhizosphaerae]